MTKALLLNFRVGNMYIPYDYFNHPRSKLTKKIIKMFRRK